jgi:hypothetical protein
MDIAKEILRQLGGNKFIVMTGAKNFLGGSNYLSFRLPGGGGFTKNGINAVKIILTPADLYDIEYLKIRAGTAKVVSKSEGIYNDQLRANFEENTGLRTSLS